MTYTRYAIYHLPDAPALADWGARWLGWDAVAARASPPPVPEAVEHPRRYGFHATLKPPFALAPGQSEAALIRAVADMADRLQPTRLTLERTQMGRWLALCPVGDVAALNAMAFDLVRGLDAFRAPMDPAERARRIGRGLSPDRLEMLDRWGYPHVGSAFRFHLTLTGRLDDTLRRRVEDALAVSPPPVTRPVPMSTVSVMGERADGFFEQVQRFPLAGIAPASVS